jgi:hypothetical protein
VWRKGRRTRGGKGEKNRKEKKKLCGEKGKWDERDKLIDVWTECKREIGNNRL